MNFQTVTSPDGLFLHLYGPIEGRRHDWTLYTRRESDRILEMVMRVGNFQYLVYGDSPYKNRVFLNRPFAGSNLTVAQTAFNQTMASARVIVEWLYKEVKLY